MKRSYYEQSKWLGEIRDYLSSRAQTWFDRNFHTFDDDFIIFKRKFLITYNKDPKVYENKLMTTR